MISTAPQEYPEHTYTVAHAPRPGTGLLTAAKMSLTLTRAQTAGLTDWHKALARVNKSCVKIALFLPKSDIAAGFFKLNPMYPYGDKPIETPKALTRNFAKATLALLRKIRSQIIDQGASIPSSQTADRLESLHREFEDADERIRSVPGDYSDEILLFCGRILTGVAVALEGLETELMTVETHRRKTEAGAR
jgi:hypothetical protein